MSADLLIKITPVEKRCFNKIEYNSKKIHPNWCHTMSQYQRELRIC